MSSAWKRIYLASDLQPNPEGEEASASQDQLDRSDWSSFISGESVKFFRLEDLKASEIPPPGNRVASDEIIDSILTARQIKNQREFDPLASIISQSVRSFHASVLKEIVVDPSTFGPDAEGKDFYEGIAYCKEGYRIVLITTNRSDFVKIYLNDRTDYKLFAMGGLAPGSASNIFPFGNKLLVTTCDKISRISIQRNEYNSKAKLINIIDSGIGLDFEDSLRFVCPDTYSSQQTLVVGYTDDNYHLIVTRFEERSPNKYSPLFTKRLRIESPYSGDITDSLGDGDPLIDPPYYAVDTKSRLWIQHGREDEDRWKISVYSPTFELLNSVDLADPVVLVPGDNGSVYLWNREA